MSGDESPPSRQVLGHSRSDYVDVKFYNLHLAITIKQLHWVKLKHVK
jgi:hypothetical protein